MLNPPDTPDLCLDPPVAPGALHPPAASGDASLDAPVDPLAGPPPRLRVWPWFGLFGVCGGILIGNSLVFLLLRDYLGTIGMTADKVPMWIQIVAGATMIHGFGLLGILAMLGLGGRGTWRRELELNPVTGRQLRMTGLAFVVMLVVVIGVATIIDTVLRQVGYEVPVDQKIDLLFRGPASTWLAMAVVAVLVAPFVEEVVFRNVLFRSIRLVAPKWLAVAVTSILFAAVHQSMVQFVPLVLLAVVMQEARERTNSLWPPILLHALFNGTNVAYVTLLSVYAPA